MPSKQAKRREQAKQLDTLEYRAFSVRAESTRAEERSVEAVIASENPVPMPDLERYELVPEVLRADGAILPRQVPLLNSHARRTVSDQLGSARDLRREDDKIVGRLHFASTADAQEAFRLVHEGHATDVSAGYQVLEKTFVPRGKTVVVAGREYTGPVNVVTKWKIREVSQTPIGSDEQAKLRGLDLTEFPEEKGFTMNEKLRALLESRGMPQGLSDDDAQRWAVEHNFGERKEPPTPPTGGGVDDKKLGELISRSVEEATRKALEDAEKQRLALRGMSDTLCKIAGITPTVELRSKLDACRSREEIEKAILDHQEERSKRELPFSPVVAGPAAVEKFTDGMRTALVLRALDHVAPDSDEAGLGDGASRRERAVAKVFPVESRSKDAAAFRNASLFDLARQYVESVYGVRTNDLTREHTAIVAMFGPQRGGEILGLELRDAGAYHTTGSFAELTRDAINKSMMLGYTEARSTWEMVMRRGASVPDFKQINRLVLGAVPNLPVWPDNEDPHKASVADAREYYAVECRSIEMDFSYRLLINDDMDALSRTPGMLGNAARRTVNKVAWTQITANPLLRDGVALFSAATGARKRKNLETGAVSDYTAAINLLTANMMVMRGENTPEGNESDDILSLMPRSIVFPAALRGTLLQLVRSQSDPKATHAGVTNINNTLTPVVEPLLDANSATAFYLFADTAEIDTVEVTFLQGQETPQLRQHLDPKKLSQSFIVLQTFASKALNHRGIQKHAGA